METTYTNAASTSQPKQKYSKRVIAAVIALIAALLLMLVLIPTTAHAVEAGKAEVNGTEYASLTDAIAAAPDDATINLGAGEYTTWKDGGSGTNSAIEGANKTLTFVGSSTGETSWIIGSKTYLGKSGEYNSDYSFAGNTGTLTFKNMTLKTAGGYNYLGFSHTTNTVVNSCVIEGESAYWGYTSATFTDTTFNCPGSEYALWTYSSPTMTFDTCTFNAAGKVINVYTDYGASRGNITINFANCTVNSTTSNKAVLNINDSNMGSCKYIINISGTNTVNGINPEDLTCSKLFGFGGKLMASWRGSNSGRTDVSIDGTTVWTGGKMVAHEIDCTNDKYTDGYKDNAYTITEGEWTTDPTTGLEVREIVKTCNYCGWSSKTIDTKTETKVLPGDLLIDGDTEHTAVAKVEAGSEHALIGALQISAVQEQMAALEKIFENPDGSSIALSDIEHGFTATLTVPDGITIPSDVKASATGIANTYQVASTEVSEDGKTVTVTFELTEEAKANIKTYADLKKYVDEAGDDGWIQVSVNATIDASVAKGTQLTVTGTVGGTFSATATSAYGVTRSFSYEWAGEQWPDGKDAVATDDKTIQLTVEVTKKDDPTPTPTPDPDPKPTPTPDPTPTPTPDPEPTSPTTPSNTGDSTSNTTKSTKSTSKKKSLPQTGDTFPVAIVIGLVAAGVIAIVASIVASKHSKRSH